jgi:hypothetical protein
MERGRGLNRFSIDGPLPAAAAATLPCEGRVGSYAEHGTIK